MQAKEDNRVRIDGAQAPQGKKAGYSNMMLVSIDGRNKADLYGRIIHCDLRLPVEFHNLGELVMRLDTICRTLQNPPSACEYRTLQGKLCPKQGDPWEVPLEIISPEESRTEDLYRRLRHIRTNELVYLHLVGTQHMSLQGRIKCRMTEGEYICFRSAMELMHLLSEIRILQ